MLHASQVVRLCAKSRETVASPVEHLTLHYIVKHLDTPDRSELRKLQQVHHARSLKDTHREIIDFARSYVTNKASCRHQTTRSFAA